MVVEVGGGSTEVLIVRSGNVLASHSYRLGSLRMIQSIDQARAAPDRQRALMENHINRTLTQLGELVRSESQLNLVAVGGDIRLAARLLAEGWQKGELARLNTDELAELTDEVALEAGELVALPSVVLEPLPVDLVITSNIQGAEIRVDGQQYGITDAREPVVVEVPVSATLLEVTREGYIGHRETLQLAPGSGHATEARLEVVDETAHESNVVMAEIELPSGVPTTTIEFAARRAARYELTIQTPYNGPISCTVTRRNSCLLAGVGGGTFSYEVTRGMTPYAGSLQSTGVNVVEFEHRRGHTARNVGLLMLLSGATLIGYGVTSLPDELGVGLGTLIGGGLLSVLSIAPWVIAAGLQRQPTVWVDGVEVYSPW